MPPLFVTDRIYAPLASWKSVLCWSLSESVFVPLIVIVSPDTTAFTLAFVPVLTPEDEPLDDEPLDDEPLLSEDEPLLPVSEDPEFE